MTTKLYFINADKGSYKIYIISILLVHSLMVINGGPAPPLAGKVIEEAGNCPSAGVPSLGKRLSVFLFF